MNLKINNEMRSSVNVLIKPKKLPSAVKEERRRTGRLIAILVGISLFVLAIYHAWVRKIPIVASLVVPALIMFIYVGWVLFTASRDKHRAQDAEAAFNAAREAEQDMINEAQNNEEVPNTSTKETVKNSPQESKEFVEICAIYKEVNEESNKFIKPVILINDLPTEDSDYKLMNIAESVINDKLKGFQTRRKFKRKFCRSKRHAVFKRSYSIA